MFFADDFTVEIRRQGGILVGQAFDLQVAAQERVLQVDVLKKKKHAQKGHSFFSSNDQYYKCVSLATREMHNGNILYFVKRASHLARGASLPPFVSN